MTVADAPGAIRSAQHAAAQLGTDLGPCLTTEILVPGPVISGKTSMVDAPGAILSTQQAASSTESHRPGPGPAELPVTGYQTPCYGAK